MSESLRARLIPLRDVTDQELRQWRDLAARAVEPNPFFEPDFVLPAARHLGLGEPDMVMIADRQRLHACMPVERGLLLRGLPVPHIRSWRHLYAPLGTPLVDPSRAPEVLAGLAGFMAGRAGPLGCVVLEWVGEGGPVAAGLRTGLAGLGRDVLAYRTFSRGVFRQPRPGGGEAHGRHRRTRGARRALERAFDGPVATIDRGSDPGAVERFLELEAAGWKGHGGTALLSRPGHADFFREMCMRWMGAGRLQLLSLEVSGRPVAMMCSLLAGDGLFYFKSAYDEADARYSPGVQIQLDAIDWFLGQSRVRWIDSCTDPDNPVINRLYSERRELSVLVAPPRSFIGRWPVATILRIARRLRREGGGSA